MTIWSEGAPSEATGGRTLRDAVSVWTAGPTYRSEPAGAVLGWLVRQRWLAIAGVSVVLAGTGPILGILPSGSGPGLWATLAALAAYNGVLGPLERRRRFRWATHFASQIVIDCLALAFLVHFAGGVENPFLPLFVLHVVNANILLRPRAASALLLVAIALGSAVVLGEATGLLAHHCLRAGEASCWGRALTPWSLGTLAGLVLTLVSSSAFARYLTERLHDSERRLSDTVVGLSVEKERLRETQTAIELVRSRLQAIIDCMADAVTFSDPEGRVVMSNERARELWRTPGPDGTPCPRSPESLRTLGESARSQRLFERGGRTYEATSSIVLNQTDEPLGVVTVARDITERLSIERRLMHDEKMSVVGKLAAAVAHEINNPIAVVSLYAQHALARLPAGSPLQQHLETIRRNAESCRKITGGLLELARPRKPEHRWVDLRAVCQEVADSVEPLAAKAGVSVAHESGGTLPISTEADPDQLRQAVLNLVLNAIEASRAGGRVSIRACQTQGGGAGAHLIEVRDTGEGIRSDRLAQIFQPFVTTKPAGTGLGLAVADNIVKGHGGRITVESSAGQGATFRILLPASPERSPLPCTGGEA